MFGLWLVGTGFGLVSSVATQLAPPVGAVMNFMLRPLYFLSGVLFPISIVPHPYRDWLILNPLVHGLDAARLGFAPYYQPIPGLSIAYLFEWALVTIFFGLALHVRFAKRLALRKKLKNDRS
jgi:capsular polysaccharide transport system permease protein